MPLTKGPVTRKMCPCDDAIMIASCHCWALQTSRCCRRLVIIDHFLRLISRTRSVTTLSVLSPHSEVVSLHVYRNSITAPVNITAALRDTECKHIISMKLDISPVLKCCEPSIDYCIFLPNTQSVAGLKLMCTHNGNFLSELDDCWQRKCIYIVNPCRIEFLWGCI